MPEQRYKRLKLKKINEKVRTGSRPCQIRVDIVKIRKMNIALTELVALKQFARNKQLVNRRAFTYFPDSDINTPIRGFPGPLLFTTCV